MPTNRRISGEGRELLDISFFSSIRQDDGGNRGIIPTRGIERLDHLCHISHITPSLIVGISESIQEIEDSLMRIGNRGYDARIAIECEESV